MAGTPVPEKAHPICEAVGSHFGPTGLGPGEQMECGLEQSAGGVAWPRVFTQRIERGGTGIVLGQGLLDPSPPSRSVLGKGDAPAAERAERRVSAIGATLNNLGPGGAVFKADDDDQLNHGEEIMPIAEEETGQEGDGAVAGFAQPTFNPDAVHRGRSDRSAEVEAVPDEEMDRVTVRADVGSGKHELRKMVDVLMDKTVELGYNDHARSPVRRKLPSCIPSGRAIPFSRLERIAYTIPREKKKAALNGRPDGWRWRGPPFYSAETDAITAK